ncbi:alcohol dehydrogenase family protein [Brevibacterium daeguense]|uniref:Alcohol dehydrogenase family protein n=1 Tax=Brevibacterium daeguense TaxID=909936 RepID=A0ABP8EFM9_9MICO|nr:alcohol dehydrogenase catalytic domain-containing protein [Brevibacterium daeguense]
MKALTFHGPRDIRYSEVPDPQLQDDRAAIIEVTRVSICGSDLHIYHGEGFSEDLGFCVGHEAVGVVVEAGSAVDRHRAGDRVLIPASVGCTRCPECGEGRTSMCRTRSGALEKCYGLGSRLQGSQAQFVAVPDADRNLFTIPDELSDDAAVVLTDAASTAWYGARRARISPCESVTVIGLGPIGQLAAQHALLMGAAEVFGIDPVPERRQMAAAQGVRVVEAEDPVAQVREWTGGLGSHVAVEAVGADVTIETAQRIVRRTGRVSVVGVNQNKKYSFHMERAQVKELEFAIGLCSVQFELPTLIELTRTGRLKPEAVITHCIPLSEGAEAYELMDSRAEGVCKIVLDPRA